MRPQTAIKKVANIIQDNVKDPNPNRRKDGLNWVYRDTPRQDAMHPRIQVDIAGGAVEKESINSLNLRHHLNIDVKIFWDKLDYELNYEGHYITNAEDGIDILADKVMDTLRNEAIELQDEGLMFFLPTNTEQFYTDDGRLEKVISYEPHIRR